MKNSAAAFRILVPRDYPQACRQALEACARFDWRMPLEVFILVVEDPMQAAIPVPEVPGPCHSTAPTPYRTSGYCRPYRY